MSALAAITGFLIWIAVLSLPLAIYFLVILARRGKDVERAHWADLRPIRGFPDEEIKEERPKEEPKKTG